MGPALSTHPTARSTHGRRPYRQGPLGGFAEGGSGEVELVSSGIGTFEVSWPARAEEPNGKTSPEELIAAAHSTCFSMALAHGLAGAGNPAPTRSTPRPT